MTVNLLVGSAGGLTMKDIAALGVRRVSVGGALARIGWGAFANAARVMAEQGRFSGLRTRCLGKNSIRFSGATRVVAKANTDGAARMNKSVTSLGSSSDAKSSAPSSNQASGATNTNVDWYFDKNKRWETELRMLRVIALDSQLTEELKWGCPCYTLSGRKVALIHVFKEYCAILFFKGALLKDGHHILVQQTKNVQAARQIRFTSSSEVAKLQPVVKAYILEAIAVEKSGLQVERKQTADFELPEEFESRLKALPALKKAFNSLTAGRQRGYLLHFSSAKQSKTREARVEKCMERILMGMGLDD